MSLDDLKRMGALVSQEPVEKQITWKWTDEEGTEQEGEITVLVKRFAYAEARAIADASASKQDETAAMIAAAVRLADGSQLTYDQVLALDPFFMQKLADVVSEVNGAKKNRKKSGTI